MQTATIKTAKPDRTPLMYDLLERLYDDIPVVLPPPQTVAEKERALARAKARRHYRGLRNLSNMMQGAYHTSWPAGYPRYETAFAGGKLIVFGVQREAAA